MGFLGRRGRGRGTTHPLGHQGEQQQVGQLEQKSHFIWFRSFESNHASWGAARAHFGRGTSGTVKTIEGVGDSNRGPPLRRKPQGASGRGPGGASLTGQGVWGPLPF